MTNYTQSGQLHGLKSLAQELPKYGRYGDSIVAHINPQEAAMLKAMGGSGTINPVTGLPEYFIKKVFAPVQQVWKGITNLPGIKQVSDAVTPVMQSIAPYLPYIAPFIPGVGPMMAAGIGALGAGFGKGQGGFNFKRGLMGGMTAYGLSNLYAGLQSAALSGQTPLPSDVAAASQANSSNVANLATLEAGPQAGMFEAAAQPSMGSQIMSGDFSGAASQFGDKATMMGKDFATQMSNAGEGVKNLVGAGNVPMSEAAKAVGTKFGTGSAAAMFTGASGLAALDEEQKYLDQQKAAGNIADTEYQENIARIQEARKRAEEAVLANPYKFADGGEVPGYFGGGVLAKLIGENPQIREAMMPAEQRAQTQAKQLGEMGIKQNIVDSASQQQLQDYINAMRKKGEGEQSAYRAMINNPYGFAMGGQVDDELGGDYSAMGMDQGNLQKGLFGRGYAEGGTPRFLSGGGDGMSDSIHATINGKQPARLADGEFVIPADVVSGIGNGSSKAGAKRLYGMMDRVRKERTGTTKQAKAINPAKLMAA